MSQIMVIFNFGPMGPNIGISSKAPQKGKISSLKAPKKGKISSLFLPKFNWQYGISKMV